MQRALPWLLVGALLLHAIVPRPASEPATAASPAAAAQLADLTARLAAAETALREANARAARDAVTATEALVAAVSAAKDREAALLAAAAAAAAPAASTSPAAAPPPVPASLGSSTQQLNRRGASSARTTATSDLAEAAAAVGEEMRWGGRPLVPFVSGNAAMVKFMLNEQALINRLPVGFRVLWVPIDPAALARLQRDGNGTVYSAIATDGRFSGDRSNFREPQYNRMALVKWEVSLALLDLGYDVLLLDPDLVLLRNPLPHFETLPPCDLLISMDAAHRDPDGANVRANGGFAAFEYPNFYNTGVILFRSSVRVRAWVRAYLAYVAAEYAAGTKFEDQQLFNRFVQNKHRLELDGGSAFDAIMSNRCYRYESDAPIPGTEGERAVTVFPLHPALFMPRPLFGNREYHSHVAMRPYLWHANYCDSDSDKRTEMRTCGRAELKCPAHQDLHWLLPDSADADG